MHKGEGPNKKYFSDTFYSENDGMVDSIFALRKKHYLRVSEMIENVVESKSYHYTAKMDLLVKVGDHVKIGDPLYQGNVINNRFYVDMSRLLLMIVFLGISLAVYFAFKKKEHKKLNL
jgi:hypothetical protein